ncbi:hypothetical protein D3C80_2137370 [compost metagenome]
MWVNSRMPGIDFIHWVRAAASAGIWFLSTSARKYRLNSASGKSRFSTSVKPSTRV